VPEEPDAFASNALMESRSQGAITTGSHPHLADELLAATRAIREFCRWHIAPARQVTYRRAGASPDDIYLPAMEVASIDSVRVDGVAWSADRVAAVEFDPLTGWTNIYGRRVVVEFTAGFDEVPADVVGVALELAANGLGTSLGQTREQAGTVALTFDRVGGGVDPAGSLGRRLIPYQIGRVA